MKRYTLILLLLTVALLTAHVAAQTMPVIQAVLSAADITTRLCPGQIVDIFGMGLGPVQVVTGSPPGLTVTVGGKAAAILFGSAAQTTVQLPVDLTVGASTLVVQYQGQTSAPLSIQVSAYAPGLFSAGKTSVLFLHANGSLGSSQSPANPGELITTYAIGLGATNPAVATGLTPSTPVPTTAKVTATVGGEPSTVLFAGLSTSGPGLYQLTITVPGDLTSGAYPVALNVGGITSATASLPVAITGLAVSQTGLTFQAVQGGGNPSPSTFRVLNGSSQPANYTLATSTVSGGLGWLSASPLSGTVASGQNATITVTVNPAGLVPGDYYGSISVTAPGVPNSPQFLSIVLNISGPTVNPGPVVDPTGLVFVGLLGGSNPTAQSARITNLTNKPSPFTATGSVLGAQNWFTLSQASGTVNPNQPGSVSVQPNLTGLAAGVYRGNLALQFPQDNTARSIDLLLIVTPVLSLPAAPLAIRPNATACAPTKLLPVFTSLGFGFSTSVGWPAAIEVLVRDDCGAPMKTGTITTAFSNGDPSLSLIPLNDGYWTGTWAAINPRTSALTVTATAVQASLSGTAQVGGSAAANPGVPIVGANGMVSSGSYAAAATPSPGELVAVFGLGLADGVESASSLPLKNLMQGAKLTLGGRTLPLVFTSDGQINAQIPYDLPPGTSQSLIAQHGNRLSVPQPVSIGGAEPAIFSTDLTGKGQGHIYVIPAPGVQVLADSNSPAKASDVLQIYCTGLGPVTPTVSAGTATPSDALRNTATLVTLTIGGVEATVLFAGLTPGFTGLYQINAVVPQGVKGQVPVIATVGAFSSPTVTMAVQ